MKLPIVCLALVSCALSMPVADNPSPDPPIALPATEAKTVLKEVDNAVKTPLTDKKLAEDSFKSAEAVTPGNEPKPSEKVEETLKTIALESADVKQSDCQLSACAQPQADSKAAEGTQEIKREIGDSQTKPESDPVPAVELKSVPNVNLADGSGKQASNADENIPSSLKSDSVTIPEKKVDISSQAAKSHSEPSQLESNGKSEGSETPEKREADSKPATDKTDEEKKIESPVASEEPKIDQSKNDESKSASDNEPLAHLPSVVAYEEVNGNPETAINPIDTSATGPASKSVSAADSPVVPIAGFVDDSVRVVRESINENKGEKDSSTIASEQPSKVEKPASLKPDKASKKQESAESNESKDDDSAASRTKNNSSAEDSSEEKQLDDPKKAEPVAAAVKSAMDTSPADVASAAATLAEDAAKKVADAVKSEPASPSAPAS